MFKWCYHNSLNFFYFLIFYKIFLENYWCIYSVVFGFLLHLNMKVIHMNISLHFVITSFARAVMSVWLFRDFSLMIFWHSFRSPNMGSPSSPEEQIFLLKLHFCQVIAYPVWWLPAHNWQQAPSQLDEHRDCQPSLFSWGIWRRCPWWRPAEEW